MATKSVETTIIDSADKLGLTPEQVSKFLAVTDKFGTTIEGALVQTVMMLLREANKTTVTAGISGIQGDLYEPFLWGGGSLEHAQNFATIYKAKVARDTARANGTPEASLPTIPNLITCPIVMLHNGVGRLGSMLITPKGIEMVNSGWLTNILIGDSNGTSVLKFFDNLGKYLYDLGPGGLTKIEFREERWEPVKLIYVDSTYNMALTVTASKNKYKNSFIQSETTFYRYISRISVGVNYNTTDDGKLFTSANLSSSLIGTGVYMKKEFPENARYQTDDTGVRIYPDGIHPSNEAVYDSGVENPLYVKGIFSHIDGKRASEYNAYWHKNPY